MRRRTFFARVAAAASAALFGPGAGGEPRAAAAGPEAADATWLEHVADAVVPADDGPGAVQAGVVPALRESLLASSPRLQLYAAGRARLEADARARGVAGFGALATDERSALLQALGDDAGAAPRERAFYNQVRADVLALFYTSSAGWQAIGYAPPPYAYDGEDRPEA